MGTYTLRIHGKPIEDARGMLEAADGVKTRGRTPGSSGEAGAPEPALTVTVDAPTLAAAEALVAAALPSHGSYTVGRPEPLEDEAEE